MRQITIAVMGSGGVGKSALTIRFLQNMFIQIYDPTVEDRYRKIVEINNEEILVEIIDTAGTEQFTAIRDLYFKDGHAFLLVYSINSPSSYDEIKRIHSDIIRSKDTKVPIFIVGNKCDLHDRLIPQSKGYDLARELNCGWMETSAKNIISVNEPFIELLSHVLALDKKAQKKSCTIL